MNEQHKRRTIMALSVRMKMLIGFTLLFSVVFAAAFYWFYTYSVDKSMGRIRDDLVDTIQGAAEGVDGDLLVELAREGEANEEGFSDDPRYEELTDWLQMVHNLEPRAWPYTYIPGEDEIIAEPMPETMEIRYVTDLWARYDPSKAAGFLESLDSSRSFKAFYQDLVLRTDDEGNFTTYSDEWGAWVSAYAPVTNDAGEVVGALGIDFEADYVNEVKQGIQDNMLIAFAITYLSLFVMVFLISSMMTRPIVALTNMAERIGEGDYEQDFSTLTAGRFPDEISTLAEVFAIMVEKVYQREQTLRRQVEELRIEIDVAKREKQVKEVVESEFFQELQAKARERREAHQDRRADSARRRTQETTEEESNDFLADLQSRARQTREDFQAKQDQDDEEPGSEENSDK